MRILGFPNEAVFDLEKNLFFVILEENLRRHEGGNAGRRTALMMLQIAFGNDKKP